jgi:flagellin-like protein
MEKRGISPLIATVILIGFVIAVAAVIFFWGKSYIVETAQKEGALSETKLKCNDVKFEVLSDATEIFSGNLELENKGGVEISGFKVRSENIAGGATLMDLSGKEAILALYGTAMFSLDSTGIDTSSAFDIIPMLKPEGRGAQLIPCSDKIKKIEV